MFLLRRSCARALFGGASGSVLQRRPSPGFASLLQSSPRQSTSLHRRGLRTTSTYLSNEDARSGLDLADVTDEPGIASATGETGMPDAVENAETTGDAATGGSGVSDAFGQSLKGPKRTVQPTKQLYVGNLFFSVTEDTLRNEMSRYGNVLGCRIIYDRRGLSKGYGFIEFDNVESSRKVMTELDGQLFEGRPLAIQYALRKVDNHVFGNGPTRNSPSRTLFIGNLSYEMTDKDLNDLFRDIRNVIDVRVAIDRRTGQPRGFAHADFLNVESAQKAFEQLNGKEMYDRRLRLDYSTTAGPASSRDKTEVRQPEQL